MVSYGGALLRIGGGPADMVVYDTGAAPRPVISTGRTSYPNTTCPGKMCLGMERWEWGLRQWRGRGLPLRRNEAARVQDGNLNIVCFRAVVVEVVILHPQAAHARDAYPERQA
eukprot:gene11769-biopygen1151